jgi:signal peptidase I
MRSQSRRRRALRILVELSPLLLILVARSSFANHYVVPSGSMEPTLAIGDRIGVDMRAYGIRVPMTERWLVESEPTRGDVVVFSHPVNGEVLVKRLVGLPGDVIEMSGGVLRVNGEIQPQELRDRIRLEALGATTHLLAAEESQGPDFAPARIPPRHYFFQGDHRGNSADSRFFGFVPREKLLGRAVAILHSSRPGLSTGESFWIPLGAGEPPDARLLRAATAD